MSFDANDKLRWKLQDTAFRHVAVPLVCDAANNVFLLSQPEPAWFDVLKVSSTGQITARLRLEQNTSTVPPTIANNRLYIATGKGTNIYSIK